LQSVKPREHAKRNPINPIKIRKPKKRGLTRLFFFVKKIEIIIEYGNR